MEGKALLVVLSVLATLVTSSSAAIGIVIGRGECPVPPEQNNFDISRYLGTWYEYVRFPNVFETFQDCAKAQYGNRGQGTYSVINSAEIRVKVFGTIISTTPISVDGTATVPDESKPAELRVSFGSIGTGGRPNYIVLDTDYTNYTVVFSCTKLPFIPFNIQQAWVLTRRRGVAPSNLAEINGNLTAAGLDVSNFQVTDQEGCQN